MADIVVNFLLLVIPLLVTTNAQNQQGTTVTPVRYALILRELASVTNGRAALQAKVAQFKETYDLLQRKSASAKASCRCSGNSPVAFTAHLDKDITVLGVDQPIPFDNVTLNAGNAYDARHAQFRAPFNGTYQFFVTLTNNAGYQLVAQFMLNGSPVVKIRTADDNQFHSATNGVAIHMQAGDDLWVQHAHTPTDSNRLYHGDGLYTTFSGYIVTRD